MNKTLNTIHKYLIALANEIDGYDAMTSNIRNVEIKITGSHIEASVKTKLGTVIKEFCIDSEQNIISTSMNEVRHDD